MTFFLSEMSPLCAFKLQTNGFQIYFEDICPANHYCVSQVTMQSGEANIPYKLIAYTKEKPSDECIEKGIMRVKNAWNAKSTVMSSKSKGNQ